MTFLIIFQFLLLVDGNGQTMEPDSNTEYTTRIITNSSLESLSCKLKTVIGNQLCQKRTQQYHVKHL